MPIPKNQPQSQQPQQNNSEVPEQKRAEATQLLLAALHNLTNALDKESDACYTAAERRRSTNPKAANGFQARGSMINELYKTANKAALRLEAVTEIMLSVYQLPADADGMIDLDNLIIGADTRALLTAIREHAVIPAVIHVLAIGKLYSALIQYPM